MTEKQVHLFGEDIGHERFLLALVRRIAEEEGVAVRITTGSAAGGHGRVTSELRVHQRAIVARSGAPDLLVVAVDANCEGWSKAKEELDKEIDRDIVPCYSLAVPDPHIERWYMADPDALWKALEVHVVPERRKRGQGVYKKILTDALLAGGYPVTLGGAEFADDIVEHMDPFRAGKNEPSLKHFWEEVKALMRSWKH